MAGSFTVVHQLLQWSTNRIFLVQNLSRSEMLQNVRKLVKKVPKVKQEKCAWGPKTSTDCNVEQKYPVPSLDLSEDRKVPMLRKNVETNIWFETILIK